MVDPIVIRIGPIKGPSSETIFLYAPLSPQITSDQVVFASDDKSGLELMQRKLDGSAFDCEPLLAEAARSFGVPVTELDADLLELRADVALSMRELDGLPPTEPIEHRRFLLRGLGALRNGPAWMRFIAGSTAFGRMGGVVGKTPCNADISVSFGFVPNEYLHIVLDPEAPMGGPDKFDIRIALRKSPAYLVEALDRAYGFDHVPTLFVNDMAVNDEWLTLWAAPIGTCLYALGVLREGERRKSVTVDDPVGLHFSCVMEMSS